MFGAGAKTDDTARAYEDARTADAIVRAANGLLAESGPAVPTEISSQAVFDANCVPPRVCIIGVLPDRSGAADRNKYLSAMGDVMAARRGTFKFLWAPAGAQPELEKALKITFCCPALTAVRCSRACGWARLQLGACWLSRRSARAACQSTLARSTRRP